MKGSHRNLEWQLNMRLEVSNMTISKRGAILLALYVDIVHFVVKGGGDIHIHYRYTSDMTPLIRISNAIWNT